MKKDKSIYYIDKANENLPEIFNRYIAPKSPEKILNTNDSIIIDLGNHYVGYFSFDMNYVQFYIDSPVKLLIKFCETKEEITYDFSSYNGTLSPAWLQEELITVDFPGTYSMPRRYSARYIKITVINTTEPLTLNNFSFKAVTSADVNSLPKVDFKDNTLQVIDDVSIQTLKNCMQRVFEDGPKRDRRLWIGDLRLEALTNYYTFNNLKLVRRCLYLFAAAKTNEYGILPGYIYENPKFVSGYWFLTDYALLFTVALCEYYNHSSDLSTFNDIYPIAKAQLESVEKLMDENGIISINRDCDCFIDWCDQLKKTTSLQGVYIYALNKMVSTLKSLNHNDYNHFNEKLIRAKNSTLENLYNSCENNFKNIYDDFQCSVHSAVWMILSDIISGDNARELLLNVLENEDSCKPVTPYMHHYVVEALIKLNEKDLAISYIKDYWGKMIQNGADTFYEVFIPDDLQASPYKDKMINSMCHAWSCTPSFFLRKNLK